MRLIKVGRKWVLEGEETGWTNGRQFPTKWKALLAQRIFESGGSFSNYRKAVALEPRPMIQPTKALQEIVKALDMMKELAPTPEEIEEYGEQAPYGAVTSSYSVSYFPPKLHDTGRVKSGGRVHIDIGSGGIHLMLDRYSAWDFIEWIRERRGQKGSHA